jgi:hypothetical protein
MSGTVDTEDFKERLKKICYTENFYGNFKNTCFHGAGHAILNEFGYDLQKSLDFCKEISPSESKLAYCSFGVFMELYLNLPDIEFDMKFCDSQNLLYRTSCYLEYSRNLSKKIKNIETSADAVDACKTIKEDVYRLACIKFHARNFLSFDYYDNPKQMCQVQTQTNSEKIICTATYAATLGMALTKDDNSRRYKHIVSDICKTLPFYQSGKCSDLIAEKKLYMNYTTAKDLSM